MEPFIILSPPSPPLRALRTAFLQYSESFSLSLQGPFLFPTVSSSTRGEGARIEPDSRVPGPLHPLSSPTLRMMSPNLLDSSSTSDLCCGGEPLQQLCTCSQLLRAVHAAAGRLPMPLIAAARLAAATAGQPLSTAPAGGFLRRGRPGKKEKNPFRLPSWWDREGHPWPPQHLARVLTSRHGCVNKVLILLQEHAARTRALLSAAFTCPFSSLSLKKRLRRR